MKKRKADESSSFRPLFWLYLVAAFVFLSDQATKAIALQFLKPRLSIPLVPNFFHLSFVENSGIAFGFFQGHPGLLTFVISASVLVLLICSRLFQNRPFPYTLAYGFILGGALGNWVDRIRWQHVIDFLDFRIWPVFNLADSFITVGVIVFIWFSFKVDP